MLGWLEAGRRRGTALDRRIALGLERGTTRAAPVRLPVWSCRLGDAIVWPLLALLLPLIDPVRGGQVSLQLVSLGSVNLVLYAARKFSTRRDRPFQQREGIEARIHAVDRYSFPSDHTIHAVAFAALLAVWYPLLALIAALVGLSRVGLGVHYPTDVLAGALIGLYSAATQLWLAAPVG